jgi:alcohol dehydrogenase
MKALTYDGVAKIKVVDKPKPKVESADEAVVKLLRTTICGTDLHIIKGDVPTVNKGRTLGHEGLGVIDEVGSEVKGLKKGDRVLIACITGCSTCSFCQKSMYDQCKRGGWKLGNTLDGTQAEYVRIPFASNNLYPIPPGVDERALLVFSDIIPTGLEVGVIRGNVKPGSTVAIVGAGPVGLACAITAQLYSPKKIVFFDKDDSRLEVAKKLGATDVINPSKGNVRELAAKHFGDLDGFDVVIEAVGVPATFKMCQDLVGIGGNIANVGVHGTKVELEIDRLWSRSTSKLSFMNLGRMGEKLMRMMQIFRWRW